MDNFDERNPDQKEGVIINDLRHSRDDSATPQVTEAEPVAVEPEPAASVAEPEPVIEETVAEPELVDPPVSVDEEPAAAPTPQPTPGDQPEHSEEEHQAAEMEHMKMIFGMGLKGYLSGQLAILINFTMIYLGRAPNPATGLVAVDLEAARVSIDLLEKILGFVSSELKPNDQTSLTSLIGELKYSYVQAVGGAAKSDDAPDLIK